MFATELTPDGVDSACHPSEVGEMSTSVLVEGHSISGVATLPRNDSYPGSQPAIRKNKTVLGLAITDYVSLYLLIVLWIRHL